MTILSRFLTLTGIQDLLDRVRVGGLTVTEHLNRNRKNSERAYNDLFKRAVMADTPVEAALNQVARLTKTRKRQTLNTLRNVMSAARGQARALLATGIVGTYYNIGTFDASTTEVCLSYMGASWDIPYSQIQDKPPRVSVTPHPCRSFLRHVPRGEAPPNEPPFIEAFNADPELRRDLLGKAKFEAHERGELTINTFGQFERIKLTTIQELGID